MAKLRRTTSLIVPKKHFKEVASNSFTVLHFGKGFCDWCDVCKASAQVVMDFAGALGAGHLSWTPDALRALQTAAEAPQTSAVMFSEYIVDRVRARQNHMTSSKQWQKLPKRAMSVMEAGFLSFVFLPLAH